MCSKPILTAEETVCTCLSADVPDARLCMVGACADHSLVHFTVLMPCHGLQELHDDHASHQWISASSNGRQENDQGCQIEGGWVGEIAE
jgi:hypothetical protein